MTAAPDEGGQDFVRLLDYLKASRGFDFSGYKISSLIRRVRKRMQQVGAPDYAAYLDYLEVHPDELAPLFDTVLINVTAFFRDAPAWQGLTDHVLPRLLEGKAPQEPIRCWSAGCASGEEAYTVAMLLAEALGEAEYRRRVKIYATDADEEALSTARQGSYTEACAKDIPPELLGKYFEKSKDRYVFRPDLRRTLIFGRHDLVQDAAISRIDLLTCRNTLMYFNAETQARILARFHFALNRNGYLFLGRAETLLTHSTDFLPVDLKRRIFQRVSAVSRRDRLLALNPADLADAGGDTRHARLRNSAFENGPAAQIVVSRRGFLVQANGKARQLFGLSPNDVGRPLQDLEVSYRPIELRSHFETAYTTRLPVTLQDVEWRPPGGSRGDGGDRGGGEPSVLEVRIVPLADHGGTILGASASFLDLTLPHKLRGELERANQELETAFEELQSANEELETTNEELQSTIEELETTNEELQSTNEELETMNEELQSTNEELRTLNEQLHHSSAGLDQANDHLRSILASLRAAVVVLNKDLKVEVWSDKAQELWGLRGEEAQGQPFLGLDIGLPTGEVEQPIRECLEDGLQSYEAIVEGINRRGRPIRCRVTCTPLGNGRRPRGVILLMEDAVMSESADVAVREP